MEVTDEFGAVQGELLHADCLRTTYGRAQMHNLDPTQYMRPQEKWRRIPVPATASMLAPPGRHSYEHQQGVALLASVPYVIDFVEMKRFEDDKQLQLLQNMRVPGGIPVPEDTWKAIVASQYKAGQDAAQLLECSKWHEAAYDWRTVSFAMQTKARLQAKQAGRILYYIQAVDRVSQRRRAKFVQHEETRRPLARLHRTSLALSARCSGSNCTQTNQRLRIGNPCERQVVLS